MKCWPRVSSSSSWAKQLIEPLDAGQSAYDVTADLDAHGQRHGRPQNLKNKNVKMLIFFKS